METEEEHKSEIQDLDEFNDINIDQRALESFVPGRYLKATCTEKENKIRSNVAELLDPLHMPCRVRQLVSNEDMSRQSRECHLNMWRTLIDRIFSVEKASVTEMKNLDKCKRFFENFNWPTDPLMSFADTETVFFNSHEIISAAANFVSNLEDVLADDWVLGTVSDIYEKHDDLNMDYNRPKNLIYSCFNNYRRMKDLLDAPLEMRSRLYYSLKILYSFTMENHPDYGSLKELLVVLSNIPGISRTSNGNNVFPLPIKSGYVVQQMKKIRKLRYLFLFPNYLIITSLKFGCRLIVTDVDNKKEYYFIFTSYFQQELWRQKLNENNYPVDDIHYYSGTLDVLVHQVLSLEEDAATPLDLIALQNQFFQEAYTEKEEELARGLEVENIYLTNGNKEHVDELTGVFDLYVKTSERQAKVIQMLLRTLPEPNRSVFEFLMAHIVKVCQNRSKNKVEIWTILLFGYYTHVTEPPYEL
ncbi:active breakpoint cluster region-related protein-like isoform X1 [Octopus vulgaris]|uniref:Active breakpoint cluster region-related protein-like isoform X1 n=1 Tax=Octopus vulgaris TaxID=6645 RepID=A0AA36AYV4_OCTVU|nr:active breakpoint cluster region-related protein-like isoform X1 [Octopus vulgaris]